MRGTYTALNKDFSQDVLHLSDLGIKHISIEPVSSEEGFAYGLGQEDIALLDREYDIIAQEYIKRKGTEKEFSFFHFYVDLEASPCVYKKYRVAVQEQIIWWFRRTGNYIPVISLIRWKRCI